MATVSILIPAYKADFLKHATASALGQTFQDIEILVGDDTPDARLSDLVNGIGDPRIQYFHHGFQKGTRNSRALWERASGRYVKWLFDDDVLMPTSVETLVNALRANPDSPMAFHERVFIDRNDKIVAVPPAQLKVGEMVRVDRAFLVQNMVGYLNNMIGEPSNVMLDRTRVDITRVFDYASLQLDFLGDVAMYLNLAELGPLTAVGGYLSAFRKHETQSSNPTSPNFSAGFYEWELMVRGEASAGRLDIATLDQVRRLLARNYAVTSGRLPEIARLASNLNELVERNPLELLQSERFQADLAHARRAVAERIAARRKAATPQKKTCAICERTVAEWLPHPEVYGNREFMQQVHSVGSTLEHHHCPHCYCNDRERHLWLYFDRAKTLANLSQKRVLHIAPEAGIEHRIRALKPLEYVCGDLTPKKPEHRKVNVERLDFTDGYFDLIICNHVLEHVDRPDAALAEFSRCLSPNGQLVAQTPYSPTLKHTFELNIPPNEAFATRYFGQGDHVRLFGADIAAHFRAAGLNGDLYPHATVLAGIDPELWGCNGREPFFLFSKGVAPAFPL
jgi:glycosyltransferase involved in cell wall biosynthesis